MEPMALGSPTGSPAGSSSPFLPSYLLGNDTPQTPARGTLSPNKNRTVSFANTPTVPEYGRAMGQKTLFGAHTPVGPMPSHNMNASVSGPPTQGLFDSLREENNQVLTPIRGQYPDTPIPSVNMSFGAAGGINQSYQQNLQNVSHFNNTYSNNNSFNISNAMPMSPISAARDYSTVQSLHMATTPRASEFWITIWGFPPSAASTILQHFAQCGTVLDKKFPPGNGNWVHLRYSSRLECDRAVNFHKCVLGNIMIAVDYCDDKTIFDKENMREERESICKLRPLTQVAYNSAKSDLYVNAASNTPQKSSGLMNKAMDYLFGW